MVLSLWYRLRNEGKSIKSCSISESMSKPSHIISNMVLSPATVPSTSGMHLLSICPAMALAYPGLVVITHRLPEKAISVILSVMFVDILRSLRVLFGST